MEPEAVRTRLEARMRSLVARDDALSKHLRGEDGRNEADFSDRVAFTEMDEVLEQLDDSAREEIRAIQGALKRLEAGDYGVCLSCGEAIPDKRLEILPHTAHCVSCMP